MRIPVIVILVIAIAMLAFMFYLDWQSGHSKPSDDQTKSDEARQEEKK